MLVDGWKRQCSVDGCFSTFNMFVRLLCCLSSLMQHLILTGISVLGEDHPGGEERAAAEPAPLPQRGSRQHARRSGEHARSVVLFGTFSFFITFADCF
jgi:hypothetical protein